MSSTADVLSGVSGNAVSPKSKRSRQRKTGPLTPEERAYIQALFHDGEIDRELRDMLAGSQSFLSWSSGTEGGYLVPMEYQEQLAEASAQMDPLLDESPVELIREKSLACRPKQLFGWDLSTVSSSQVGEGGQAELFVPQPLAAGDVLNGWMHKVGMLTSMEFDQDTWRPTLELMMRVFGVGFARGMGKQLVNGTGSSQPQGLLTGAVNSNVTTAGAGVSFWMTSWRSTFRLTVPIEYRQVWVGPERCDLRARRARRLTVMGALCFVFRMTKR